MKILSAYKEINNVSDEEVTVNILKKELESKSVGMNKIKFTYHKTNVRDKKIIVGILFAERK